MTDIITTVIGNLTTAPELRYTQNGIAVANFTVASTKRTFDRANNTWVDGKTTFIRCSVWREAAEHAAASLDKGHQVIVYGELEQREYEVPSKIEGAPAEKRTSYELEVIAVGPSLAFGTTTFAKSASKAQNAQAAQMVGAPAGGAVNQSFVPQDGAQAQFAPQAQAPVQQAPAQQFAPQAAPAQQFAPQAAPAQQFAPQAPAQQFVPQEAPAVAAQFVPPAQAAPQAQPAGVVF